MLLRLLVYGASLVAAFAQNLSVGIAAGGAPTDAFESSTSSGTDFYSQSADYVAGASVEYRMRGSFSIEADGLFRELHLAQAIGSKIIHTPVVTWEFPVLAKYRFHVSKLDPFVEAGAAFRTTGNLNSTNPSHDGFAAGVGVAAHWRGFEIAPTLRYTRWARDNGLALGPEHPESKQDQIEVLLGISRRPQTLGNFFGRRFSLGAIAAVTFTHDVPNSSMTLVTITHFPPSPAFPPDTTTTYQSGRNTFLAGAGLEIALFRHLFVEADAVYHPIRETFRIVFNGMTEPSSSYTAANTWEFPVLAKYKFGAKGVKPFAEAGPSFRLPMAGVHTTGVSVGGGAEIRWSLLKIAPAVRYTRWTTEFSPELGFSPQPNQVELLMGLFL